LSIVNELLKLHSVEVIIFCTQDYESRIVKIGARFQQYKYFPSVKTEPNFNIGSGIVRFFIRIALGNLFDLINFVDNENPDGIFYDSYALHAKYLCEYLYLRYTKVAPSTQLEPIVKIAISTQFAYDEGDEDVFIYRKDAYKSVYLKVFYHLDHIYTGL
jgi:hypothetical protein